MEEITEFAFVERLDRTDDLLLTASVSADCRTVRMWDGSDAVRFRTTQAKALHEWLGRALGLS